MEQNEIWKAVWELRWSLFKKEGSVQQAQEQEGGFTAQELPCAALVQLVGAHQMGCSYLCCHKAGRPEPGKSWRGFKYDFSST